MEIRLTQTVQKGGCAAKIAAEVLREALSAVDLSSMDPNVLLDGRDFDDAGVYRISSEVALVQTLDFFTPIVDTPELFGKIAAANALSDVYAMGGVPKTAMAILAFPISSLEPSIMSRILEGGNLVVKDAGCSIVGGHSIDDDTLKFGLSVTGVVHPDQIWSNRGARPGDRLILTKPLGTGTLCAGLKNGDYQEQDIRDALESMCLLNRTDDLIPDTLRGSIHSATDITGFGLLGHALHIARGSQVRLKLEFSRIPHFQNALASLEAENLTKAHRTNRNYTEAYTLDSSSLGDLEKLLLSDPQTSGGLLLSVDPQCAEEILERLKNRFKSAAIIGSVEASDRAEIEIHD